MLYQPRSFFNCWSAKNILFQSSNDRCSSFSVPLYSATSVRTLVPLLYMASTLGVQSSFILVSSIMSNGFTTTDFLKSYPCFSLITFSFVSPRRLTVGMSIWM